MDRPTKITSLRDKDFEDYNNCSPKQSFPHAHAEKIASVDILDKIYKKMSRNDVKRGKLTSRLTLHHSLIKKCAFTLAEVLIVISIIGVIAQMTIPELVNNVQKQVTVVKVQKFYTNMSQAIKLSEIDNGSLNTWNFGASYVASDTLIWFNTYLAPYLKYDNAVVSDVEQTVYVNFNDGTKGRFFMGTYMDITFYTNPGKTTLPGKNWFYLEIIPNATQNAFRPYDSGATGVARAKWTTGTHACTPTGDKIYCAGLVMYDGWRIADDYPW